MRKVLIISHAVSTPDNIASTRVEALIKHLPEYGWEPFSLTFGEFQKTNNDADANTDLFYNDRLNQNILNFVKTYKNNPLFKFLIKIYENFLFYPDSYSYLIKDATQRGKRVISKNKFDAIISSAHPVTSHLIASSLAKDSKIPWIADFRDLWTQNHYNSYFWIRTFFEKRLEKHTLINANALITVSVPLANKLSEIHFNRPIFPILNGFDCDQINSGTPLSKEFTITHTGNLYDGRRDPKMLFKCIRELIDEKMISNGIILIHFFGNYEKSLLRDIKKYGLEKDVYIHGLISRESALEKQRESQILLLLTWNNPEENGVYTSKVFEYFASRRPILSMGYPDRGILKSLLDQTQTGVHVTNEEEIKDYLMKAYHEYKECGSVKYQGITDEILKYSDLEMTKKFAEVLEKVSN